MRTPRHTLMLGYVYAALVITGGLIGFIKRGSTMSLVAGGSTGLLAGYGALVGLSPVLGTLNGAPLTRRSV